MTTIEQAIERMKKVEAACDELMVMVEPEIKELKRRKRNARTLIDGFNNFNSRPDDDCKALVEKRAKEIAEGKLALVSCMGVGIKV